MADEATDKHGALAWFEIHVSDLARAADFYGKVFGWTFEPLAGFSPGNYLMIRTRGGSEVTGGIAETVNRPAPQGESSVLYLEVEDIQGGIDAAVAAGGSVHRPRMNIGGDHGYCAIIRDPEGNHVGLWAGR